MVIPNPSIVGILWALAPKVGVEKSTLELKLGKSVWNFGRGELTKAIGERLTSLKIRKPNRTITATLLAPLIPSFQEANDFALVSCFCEIAESCLVRSVMVELTALKRKQSAVPFHKLIILFTVFMKNEKCSESAVY